MSVETGKNQVTINNRNGAMSSGGMSNGAMSSGAADLLRAEKVGALVMAARLHLRRGERDGARTKLKEAFVLDATDCQALELLGDIFLEEAEQQKAIQVFERGLKYHPRHHAFEEKIALAHLDLAEMERDRLAKEHALTPGAKEQWQNLKPARALGLSLLIPGAGHIYAEENERAAWFFGAWLLSFFAWYLPLHFGFRLLARLGGARTNFSSALAQLHPFWLGWFYLSITIFTLIPLIAAFDAWRTVEARNAARRRFLGL